MNPLWCQVNGPWVERLHHLLRTTTLWTARPHAGERLSLALDLLVREGRMRGVGGTEHAA